MTRVKFVSISCLLIFIKRFLINLTTSHLKTKILKKRQVVSFTMSKYSRGQPASSSSQPFQGPPPLWKSKRPFDNCFLSKEGNLFQHNFNSSKTFFGDCTNASVKTSFGTKTYPKRRNRKLSTCRKTAVFSRKLENSDKRSKNIRIGIWVKKRL